MRKMNRKLMRDLRGSKGLFIAVTVIVFLAVAFFGAMFMASENLRDSYDYSYEQLRFADFTVKVAQDAEEAHADLKALSGVQAVTARINADFSLRIPGEEGTKVLARTISLPADRSVQSTVVNDVQVESGAYFPKAGKYLLVEKNFADHHDLRAGQTVYLTVRGQETPFEISGVATSPEYIFPAKSRQEVLVSPEVWGVVFVPHKTAVDLLQKPVNEFCFLVNQGADRSQVIAEVEQALAPYQVMDVVTREDQPSNAGLEMDLEQFATLGELFPLFFIIVGAMATYILLTRIVYNQRTQIGLMRAMGYSGRNVMVHYLGFALVIGLVGSLFGTGTGHVLAGAMTRFYAELINLPFVRVEPRWLALSGGFLLGLVPCIIAGLIPAWAASRIAPAEAMRAPAPAAGRKLLIERLLPVFARMSSVWKIPLRSIFRNRRRSLYTVIGVTFGISLILVSAGMIDSIQDLMNFMFHDVQRYDARVEFADPQRMEVAEQARQWEGVTRVEPLLEIPVRLEHGTESYSTLAIALEEGSILRGLYSPSENRVDVSPKGVLLSEALQGTLDIRAGERLKIVSVAGTFEMPVLGFVKEPMGSFAYLSLDSVESKLGGSPVMNSLMLAVSPDQVQSVRERAYQLQSVASVELTQETRNRVDDMMASAMAILWIMVLFGAALAMAIVFTTVTVNILERRREIATMRTLGESRRRIGMMVTIENLLLGLAALVPGMILGYLLALYFFSLFQGDMFTFDLVIFPRTYVIVVAIVMAVMLLSEVPSLRNLNRLDLAKVTKEQAS